MTSDARAFTTGDVTVATGSVLNALRDAVIIAGSDSHIAFANEACTALLGWSPEELIGASLESLIPERFRSQHRLAFEHWSTTWSTSLAGTALRLPALHRDGTEREIELVISPWSDGDHQWVAGILRDQSDRTYVERRSAVEHRLLDVISEAADFAVTVSNVLETLAVELGWDYAGIWIPNVRNGRLESRVSWSADSRLDPFAEVTRASSFTRGQGLPGQVQAEGAPLWLEDLTTATNFPRREVAVDAGLRSAVAFPILDRDRVLAVIELLRVLPGPPDQDLLDLLTVVGRALGEILARRHAEEVERLQRTRHELAVSAAGIGVWDWDARSGTLIWSEDLEIMYGLEPGSFEGTFDHYVELIHPDDRAELLDRVQHAMATREDHYIIHRVNTKDGDERWVEGLGRVQTDDRDEVVGMSGVAIDVTEREQSKRERQLLLEREQHARSRAEAAFLRTREISHILQRSLLPPELPEAPGLEMAARYVAASQEGAEVGGDFYDAFPLSENSWVVAVGDVCGKGAEAAALTGRIRYALRAAAFKDGQPRSILATLADTLERDSNLDGRFCTLIIGRFDVTEGRDTQLTLARAGHPPAIIVHTDGRVTALQPPGPLLGVTGFGGWSEKQVSLSPGDAVVLYTDGVVDQRGPDGGVFGDERLLEILKPWSGASAEKLVEVVERSLLEYCDHPDDDLAVLVVRATPA